MSKPLLKDPLSLVAKEILNTCDMYDIDLSTKKAFISAIQGLRSDVGNKTWYIQKNHKVWDVVIDLWDNHYQIKVRNGLHKSKAFKEIAELATEQAGQEIGYYRVADTIKSRNRKMQVLETHLGKFEEDDIFSCEDD